MLKEYGQRAGERKRFGRYFLVIPAAIIFFLGLVLFGLLSNLRTGKMRTDVRQMEEKTRRLLDSVLVAVSQSGYIQRNVGSRELYVPAVYLLISNESASMVEDLELTCYFNAKEGFGCQGYARIFRLRPGEITEALLRCIEATGFGTVVQGVPLAQTAHPMHYQIQMRHKETYASLQNGDLTFKIIKSVPDPNLTPAFKTLPPAKKDP